METGNLWNLVISSIHISHTLFLIPILPFLTSSSLSFKISYSVLDSHSSILSLSSFFNFAIREYPFFSFYFCYKVLSWSLIVVASVEGLLRNDQVSRVACFLISQQLYQLKPKKKSFLFKKNINSFHCWIIIQFKNILVKDTNMFISV